MFAALRQRRLPPPPAAVWTPLPALAKMRSPMVSTMTSTSIPMKIHRDETPVCGYQRMVCSTRSIQTSAGIAVESEIVRRDFGCRDESVVFLLNDPDFIVLHRNFEHRNQVVFGELCEYRTADQVGQPLPTP